MGMAGALFQIGEGLGEGGELEMEAGGLEAGGDDVAAF